MKTQNTQLPVAGKSRVKQKLLTVSKAFRICRCFRKTVKVMLQSQLEFNGGLEQLRAELDNQHKTINCCVNTVHQCQKQTASLVNRDLERHALIPAVKALARLAEEIYGIDKLINTADKCKTAAEFTEHIHTSSQIAGNTLAHLDITIITAVAGQKPDPKLHDIQSAVETDNSSLHGKTARLLSSGITYRGEILKKAKVSVYRFIDPKC